MFASQFQYVTNNVALFEAFPRFDGRCMMQCLNNVIYTIDCYPRCILKRLSEKRHCSLYVHRMFLSWLRQNVEAIMHSVFNQYVVKCITLACKVCTCEDSCRSSADLVVVGLCVVTGFSLKLFAVQPKGCELFADPQFNIPTLGLLEWPEMRVSESPFYTFDLLFCAADVLNFDLLSLSLLVFSLIFLHQQNFGFVQAYLFGVLKFE